MRRSLVCLALLALTACDRPPPERDDTKVTSAAPVSADAKTPEATKTPPKPPTLDPGDHEFRIDHDGLRRLYYVHVPEGTSGPRPVVLALHGGGGNAKGVQRAYDLGPVSDNEGFLVVYPEGVAQRKLGKKFATWNVGACCKKPDGPDDVVFLDKVLADLATRTQVDASRVYAVGLSNGSVMARELACQRSDKIAAIAITGALGSDPCPATRTVPTLYVAGKKDPCAPYDGGPCGGCWQVALKEMGLPVREIKRWECEPITTLIDQIAAAGECGNNTHETYAKSSAMCRAWSNCKDGAEIQFCVDSELGHEWPGGPESPLCEKRPDGKVCKAYRSAVGPRSDNLRMASYAWGFMRRFSLPSG